MRSHKFNIFKSIFLLCTIFIFMCMPRLSAIAQSGTDGNTDSPQSNPATVSTDNPTGIATVPEAPIDEPVIVKRVLISLADQKMWVFEGENIINRFKVSTGVPGHRTPPGEYSVHKKAPRAYSQKYEAWMLQWMAITGDGQYGMHALEGNSYLRHLGSVASHGCIRLSHDDAKWLYNWADIGLEVKIVTDWEEPLVTPSPGNPGDIENPVLVASGEGESTSNSDNTSEAGVDVESVISNIYF